MVWLAAAMSSSLGALFVKTAVGPVEHAGRCIMGRQVDAGLNELAADRLRSAVDRAIATVAREAGVSEAEVAELLPMAELLQQLAELDEDQQRAVHAWQQHAGHFGGLLEGITDLTMDGHPPDVSLCLERLAVKVQADKAWSRPLKALSRSTMAYAELLRQAEERVDAGSVLQNARRARRLRRLLIGGGIGLGLVLLGALVGWLTLRSFNAQSRVAAILARPEACAVEQVAGDDLELCSEEQQQAVAERRKRCADERERQRQAEEERQRKAAAAKAAAERAKQRAAECAKLVAALDEGKLDDRQAALAGGDAELIQRIAWGRLKAADLAPPSPKLPCADTPQGKAIAAAFEQAVVASTGAWLTADDLSDAVRAILTANRAKLRPRPKLLYGLHAETKAKRALVSGDPKQVEQALRLCDLKRSLEIVRGPYCDSLVK